MNMVSEGVDVPRLVVAAYATVKRTDLFFRQAVGRVVRRRPTIPTTSSPPSSCPPTRRSPDAPSASRSSCASRSATRSARHSTSSRRRAWRAGRDFQPLDAQVEPGGMIVAGVHYGRAEVDAARRLLRELGQSERALRSVLEFVRRERVGRSPPPAAGARCPPTAASSTSARALDRLARRWAQLRREIDPSYTWPQAQARVNRAMGVAPRARRRRGRARRRPRVPARELAKLARDYPEQAERLRIPASVEAIDGRLAALTNDG